MVERSEFLVKAVSNSGPRGANAVVSPQLFRRAHSIWFPPDKPHAKPARPLSNNPNNTPNKKISDFFCHPAKNETLLSRADRNHLLRASAVSSKKPRARQYGYESGTPSALGRTSQLELQHGTEKSS